MNFIEQIERRIKQESYVRMDNEVAWPDIGGIIREEVFLSLEDDPLLTLCDTRSDLLPNPREVPHDKVSSKIADAMPDVLAQREVLAQHAKEVCHWRKLCIGNGVARRPTIDEIRRMMKKLPPEHEANVVEFIARAQARVKDSSPERVVDLLIQLRSML